MRSAKPTHFQPHSHREDTHIAANPERQTRRNEDIRVPFVRVIDANGDNLGVLARFDAMRRAKEQDLDLVEIQPNAEPPVCRIMDFGKHKFELQKKAGEAKRKQKQMEIKEMKFRPGTDEADYQTKLRQVRSFLEAGDKVKINLRFRGREMAHQDLGGVMLNRIEQDLAEDAIIEQRARMEQRVMSMMLAPKKKV